MLNFHKNCWFFKPIFLRKFWDCSGAKGCKSCRAWKCCQTHIFLQNFVLIQPRTSPPKICKISTILQIFGGRVLGCIKTKFCKKLWVWQHFSSSTRFASFCTAAISNFSQKIGLKNCEFRKIFANFGKFYYFLKKCDFGAVQRSALCRSRRELSNAYFLAKSGFDTAENEPCKVCPLSAYKYYIYYLSLIHIWRCRRRG